MPQAAPAHPDLQQTVHTLYEQHHGWLVQLLRRKLGGDREHALDLAHDTFERLMRGGIRQALDEPRAYLTTVARRLAIDDFRRRALEQAWLDMLASQPEALAPSPETRLLVLESLHAVCKVIDAMPPRMRQTFILAQFDDLPYAEIAQRLNVSLNVVQKDMVKAWRHCYSTAYDAA